MLTKLVCNPGYEKYIVSIVEEMGHFEFCSIGVEVYGGIDKRMLVSGL